MKKEIGIASLLFVLCAVTSVLNHQFLSATNLTNLANSIGLYGIFGLGLGVVIITGGIDLSVGSVFAFAGVLLAMMLTEWHWPWPLAALAAIAIPTVLGWANGLLVTRLKIQPFVVTLCGLMIYRGLARYIADDGTKGVGASENFETLKFLAAGRLFNVIPMPFVMLVFISIIMWFVLHRSTYGRYLFAVGRNEEATRFSGINTRWVVTSSYVVCGILTGISGILIAFYTTSIGPANHGNAYELYGVAAAVLGGCSLRGGEGSVIGIIIGTALFQVLQNVVNLLGIDSALNFTFMGTVLLIGVVVDQLLNNRAAKKTARA